MKQLKRNLLATTICFSLMGVSGLATASVPDITPANYDTIVGDYGQFIDAKSDKFVLSQSEWAQIQVYVEGALGLPITESSMKTAFAIPDDVPFANFQPLLEEYGRIHNTADQWKRDIYPGVIDLAFDLSSYASVHSDLIIPVLESLNEMRNADDTSEAEIYRDFAIEQLKNLKEMANNRQNRVGEVVKQLNDFSTDLETENAQLATLKTTHSEFLDDDGSALKAKVKKLEADIQDLNEEYDYNVKVSASAVAYIWFPLASIPVMGVYGDRAEKARFKRNQLQEDLAKWSKDLTYQEHVYSSFSRSTASITTIKESVEQVIPHVNELKLHWQEIDSDFNTVLELLEKSQGPRGIENAKIKLARMLTTINLGQVQKNWLAISVKAKQFAQNAYVEKAN
ncbi:alpha-xenorhabdolysin family binary toxin subunit A [uncultured Photobacterium sp.]|uniref:alpha-xenorhabdolysin family binary toxin subunit A n=1 Tax=uncultured Photobacterium sp. TaxID=173973 RepID=UPI002603A9E3|nr:alpha-xenorhabdolysin family binary toxin subunit A [uncultured Photobacterium sp.]